jgi:hypothetical protein
MNETLTIGTFVLGMTQLIKDSGYVQGKMLQLVAVVLGAFATLASIYYPDVWAQLSGILLAAGITGTVSFADEKLEKKAELINEQRE